MKPTADVLVIGAGPAGINAAYALSQAGIDYRIIERAQTIAPTWSSLYPSLRLNTSRFYSHLPGRKFPLHWGMHPTARQYHHHLSAWTAEQNLPIEYGIEVHRVAPRGDGCWQVESSEGTHSYRSVIPATGVFDNPQLPRIPGMDGFGGEIIHSREFRHPRQVAGKRVLVVGNGPSGTDIAVSAGQAASGGFCWQSIRSGVDSRPRYPYGMLRHFWMLLGERLPADICAWLQRRTGSIVYNQADFGLWAADSPSGAAVGYRGPELINAVREGQVVPTRNPVSFDRRGAQLADGGYLELDMVIMATGYQPVLHQYMDIDMQFSREAYALPGGCDWDVGPNGLRGWPLRDTSTHPNGRQVLGHAGLYLVGVFYKGRGAFYNMGVEAQIAAGQLRGYLSRRHFPAAAPCAAAV